MKFLWIVSWIIIALSFYIVFLRTKNSKNIFSISFLFIGIFFTLLLLILFITKRFSPIIIYLELLLFLAALIFSSLLASISLKKIFPVLYGISLIPMLLNGIFFALRGLNSGIFHKYHSAVFPILLPLSAALSLASAVLMSSETDTKSSLPAVSGDSWIKSILYGLGCLLLGIIGWGMGRSQNKPRLAGAGIILFAGGIIYIFIGLFKMIKRSIQK
ncbi:MAG TPA: hypothetical protein PLM72_05625 [Spirochaetota bacterium]|nr:hypothetical protein [Spirochaetota bacterium]